MASEEKTEKSSPTTSGPDSDIGSVKELPQDEETDVAQTSDLSNKVNAGKLSWIFFQQCMDQNNKDG